MTDINDKTRNCKICKKDLLMCNFQIKSTNEYYKNCSHCIEKFNEYRKTNKCEHRSVKYRCIVCSPHLFCSCNRLKTSCTNCSASNKGTICEHNKERRQCSKCDYVQYFARRECNKYRQSLKQKKPNNEVLENLGLNINDYKKYLESKMSDGMDWINFGDHWTIDHIIPLKYLINKDPITLEKMKQRLHFSNTQPLLVMDNLKKGNKYIG